MNPEEISKHNEKLDLVLDRLSKLDSKDFDEIDIEIDQVNIGSHINLKGIRLSLSASILVAFVISFLGYLIYA